MRISPKSLSPADALAKAKAKVQARDEERDRVSEAAAAQEAADAASDATSPAAIDAGRAQRLIERATALAERGDMGAAILAARQSLALAPDNVESHLLHAQLLERNRDFGGARAAYEKSVQLAPERADARANLARLNAYLEKSQGAARQFHFDAGELFAPEAGESAPAVNELGTAQNQSDAAAPIAATAPASPDSALDAQSVPIVAVPVAATPAAPPLPTGAFEVDSMAMFDESMLPALEARLPPTRVESAAFAPAISEGAALNSNEKMGTPAPDQPEFRAQPNLQNGSERENIAQIEAPVGPVGPVGERRKHNLPVATERRRRPVAGAALPLVPAVALAASAASRPVAAPLRPAASVSANALDLDTRANRPLTRAPLALDVPAAPAAPAAPLWQQVVSRPSFYARTLPLVGVALLGLGFLGWARGRAVSQAVAPAPTELASATGVGVADSTATVPGTTLPLPNNAAQPGAQTGAPSGTDAAGFPISNAPAVFQAPGVANAGTANAGAPGAPATNNASANNNRAANNALSTTARATNRGPNSGNARPNRVFPPSRPVPNFPGVSLAPAPIPPASVRGTIPSLGGSNGGTNIILPRPSIDLPGPSEPLQRALPPTDNGLNPAGSPNRGYVRVTEGRVGNGVIPAQPGAVARENERAADDAARNGQNDAAISQLSQAIRADSDNAGFRYQQRATLFLQRGDYNRASDDFQSAISAYQSQIASGDDVAGARRGLNSARSGLNLAIAGKRG